MVKENLRYFLHRSEEKPKSILDSGSFACISPLLRQLDVFASSSDWLIELFSFVGIGQSDFQVLIVGLMTLDSFKTSDREEVKCTFEVVAFIFIITVRLATFRESSLSGLR